MKNKTYTTHRFNHKVKAFYKDWNDGCYDVYLLGKCIAIGISEKELIQLEKILKLKTI